MVLGGLAVLYDMAGVDGVIYNLLSAASKMAKQIRKHQVRPLTTRGEVSTGHITEISSSKTQ